MRRKLTEREARIRAVERSLGRCQTLRERTWFKPGTKVVVKEFPKFVRTVEKVYHDIPGGRRLDEPVDGFVSWNVADLRKARL